MKSKSTPKKQSALVNGKIPAKSTAKSSIDREADQSLNAEKWIMPRLSKKVVLCQSCIDGVDNLGWKAGLTFSCYGARIGVRANSAEMMERLISILPPHSKPVGTAQVEYLYSLRDGGRAPQPANSRIRRLTILYLNTMRMMRTHSVENAWQHLESSLHFNVAMSAPKMIFVHAGVVVWKGRAIVIPGRTLAGKSTLVAALVRAGATYYSDEYAVFDEKGRVHPYAKPLSLRDENGDARRVPLQKILNDRPSGTVQSANDKPLKPLRVRTILVTQYKEGTRWRGREVSAGQGVLDLFDNTVMAQQRPSDALSYFNLALTKAKVLHGKRGEAQELTGHLLI